MNKCISPLSSGYRSRDSLQGGLTLVELLVSLVLGLFLLGGIISIYTSTQDSMRVNEASARMHENMRFAFEQLNREIREAGTNPCGSHAIAPLVRSDVANPSTTVYYWADWSNGTLVGYEGTATVAGINFGSAVNQRITGTDAILSMRTSINEAQVRRVISHDIVNSELEIHTATALAEGDIALVCDASSGAIFHVYDTASGPPRLSHDSFGTKNCTARLGYPLKADCASPVTKTFSANAFVAPYDPVFWYLGVSADGTSRSLYRATLQKTGSGIGTPQMNPREMVVGVDDMQIEYITFNRDVPADPLSVWIPASDATFTDVANKGWGIENRKQVVAVRLTLTFTSLSAVGTDGVTRQPIRRTMSSVISLRNREVKPS